MKKKRLFTYAFSVAALSSLITIPAAAQTDIHVLDVGQGLSVLVESQGHYMLYDGGDRTKSSYVVSYLQGQGISSLDYVIASHYDSDHLNGVVGALNVFPAGQVFSPDYTADTRVYNSFQSILKSKKLKKIWKRQKKPNWVWRIRQRPTRIKIPKMCPPPKILQKKFQKKPQWKAKRQRLH